LTYCRRFEDIENYSAAVSDVSGTWACHHRLETHFSDGTERRVTIAREELIALDMYYDRPPEEFIFLTRAEHAKVHKNDKRLSQPGSKNPMYKKSALKGKQCYNNGVAQRYFIPGQQPAGFTHGQLPDITAKIGANNKHKGGCPGKKWYHNGVCSGFFLDGQQPEGWIKGRVKRGTR
jgi:hypothetical protein